jgi:hypothetical protein
LPLEFRFELSASSAAEHNLHVLEQYHWDLDRGIRNQLFSSITPGSEFRPVSLHLKNILALSNLGS